MSGHIPDSMPEWLGQRARLSPDRRALRSGGQWLTFADLDRLVSRMRQALAARGIRPGDRVAVLAPNGIGLIGALHALPRLGAIAIPLHPRWTAGETASVLADATPALLLHDDSAGTLETLDRIPPDVGRERIAAVTDPADAVIEGDREAVEHVSISAVHTIVYTSGTTGGPKGVELTFGNHLWSAIGSALNLGLRDDDCWLACLPLCHVGGLAILMRSVIYGMPVIVHEHFDPDAVAREIDARHVTIVSLVPTMLQRLLADRPPDRAYPPRLRCVLLGGGPASRGLLESCAQRGVPVVQTYGLTEAASQVTTLAPADAVDHLGSAGKPLFPTELRIAGERGSPVAAGVSGEILVRGPSVMRGYHGRPDLTAATLRDGWLHTGDVGYLDGNGYLYVQDRRDGLIVTGGENVYAADVENTLRSHPAVADAGVTGVPDDRWGQAVVATVSLAAGATVDETELLAFCREHLAPFKVPKRIRFADVPRTPSGKLLRRTLAEREA